MSDDPQVAAADILNLWAPPGYHYESGLDAYIPDGYTWDAATGTATGPDQQEMVIYRHGGTRTGTGLWNGGPSLLPEHTTLDGLATARGGGVSTGQDAGPVGETTPAAETGPTTEAAPAAEATSTPETTSTPEAPPRPQPAPKQGSAIGTNPPVTAADQALAPRVKDGTASALDALGYFQRNGHPELTGIPTFNSRLQLWVFPDSQALPPNLLPSGEVAPGWPVGRLPTRDELPQVPPHGVEDAPRYVSTFFTDTVSAGWRDAADENTPALLRYVLLGLLPVAEIGGLVERYFVNPLLAAPANFVDAVNLSVASNEALAAGDVAEAAEDRLKATAKLAEAAAAVLVVLPIARSAAIAGREIVLTWRVNWVGIKVIQPSIQANVLTQVWNTGQLMEQVFTVDGTLTYVDGLVERNGLSVVSKLEDLLIVEHKMDSVLLDIMRPQSWWQVQAGVKFVDQLNRLLVLNSELELGGIRYVVTEALGEGGATPATTGLRAWIAETFPGEFTEGTIKVIRANPPPPEWSPWP
ncbi:hypothetical protein Dvina_17225 [Dactylosporangium vinaceum]|uniref:Uncharacterized protein n=1 Tax=Dactylosporangium vinaceum TaxID=53362 RepID=A0ABV5MK69_9ACTN|nr:hypothetical protein [Dactylosporangium vinaceum]UAB99653.1 hypothetical protein Dvina_17225 [Dactylosporangium vinaceum]